MADDNIWRPESAQRKAKDQFASASERDAGLRKSQQASKTAELAKMAKLKALRIARDAAAPPVVATPAKKPAAKKSK